MANQVWKSKDGQIISKYAEKLEPVEGEGGASEGESDAALVVPQQIVGRRPQIEDIDFRYMNGSPPKDLLNYKNMDLEMSLWAKTPTGWLSVAVLVVMTLICFALTWILWIVHG
jgi:hypothetical protein